MTVATPVIGTRVTPSGSTFTITVTGASVGDFLVLDVLLFKDVSFTPGTDTVTVPSGWVPLGGVPEPGYARGGRRQWCKIATAADLSPNTVTVTFGAAWGSFTSDRRAGIDLLPGAVRISDGPHSSGKAFGLGTFAPTVPSPAVPSLLIAYQHVGYSGSMGAASLNGWAPDTAFGPNYLAYQSPPFTYPTWTAQTVQQGWNAFAVTDIPEARGWTIGTLRFGSAGRGF